MGGAGGGRGQELQAPVEEEEDEDALKWLKPAHRDSEAGRGRGRGRGRGESREERGRVGGTRGLKLEVSVPNALGARSGEGEAGTSVTYSDDFSKDSIEGE